MTLPLRFRFLLLQQKRVEVGISTRPLLLFHYHHCCVQACIITLDGGGGQEGSEKEEKEKVGFGMGGSEWTAPIHEYIPMYV